MSGVSRCCSLCEYYAQSALTEPLLRQSSAPRSMRDAAIRAMIKEAHSVAAFAADAMMPSVDARRRFEQDAPLLSARFPSAELTLCRYAASGDDAYMPSFARVRARC